MVKLTSAQQRAAAIKMSLLELTELCAFTTAQVDRHRAFGGNVDAGLAWWNAYIKAYAALLRLYDFCELMSASELDAVGAADIQQFCALIKTQDFGSMTRH